ncbi:hypothetical protein PCANC_19225 [Puccinia coronata f. sp. avenae]|uniref:Uncharacterized protein n=1 Tax=Puccinia coronata f. sp. avenae TaxID=200324 RepID=A0A2N5SK01_9BASI|nr:hypothetical protein PCANC_19225 [Puccinia coronata f. sp. avenae]
MARVNTQPGSSSHFAQVLIIAYLLGASSLNAIPLPSLALSNQNSHFQSFTHHAKRMEIVAEVRAAQAVHDVGSTHNAAIALEKPIIAHDPSTVSAAGANLFSKSEHLEKLPPRLNQVPSEETEQFHDALTALPDLDTPADPKSLAGKSKAFEHSESFNDFEVDATTGNLNPKGRITSLESHLPKAKTDIASTSQNTLATTRESPPPAVAPSPAVAQPAHKRLPPIPEEAPAKPPSSQELPELRQSPPTSIGTFERVKQTLLKSFKPKPTTGEIPEAAKTGSLKSTSAASKVKASHTVSKGAISPSQRLLELFGAIGGITKNTWEKLASQAGRLSKQVELKLKTPTPKAQLPAINSGPGGVKITTVPKKPDTVPANPAETLPSVKKSKPVTEKVETSKPKTAPKVKTAPEIKTESPKSPESQSRLAALFTKLFGGKSSTEAESEVQKLSSTKLQKPGKQKADSPQVKADKVDTKKKPKNLDGAKGTPGEILPSAKESKSAAKNAKTLKTKPAPEVKPDSVKSTESPSWLSTFIKNTFRGKSQTNVESDIQKLSSEKLPKSQTQKADSSRVKGERVDTKKTPKNLGGGKATPEETLPSTKDSKSAAKKVKTSKAKPAPEATPDSLKPTEPPSRVSAFFKSFVGGKSPNDNTKSQKFSFKQIFTKEFWANHFSFWKELFSSKKPAPVEKEPKLPVSVNGAT